MLKDKENIYYANMLGVTLFMAYDIFSSGINLLDRFYDIASRIQWFTIGVNDDLLSYIEIDYETDINKIVNPRIIRYNCYNVIDPEINCTSEI